MISKSNKNKSKGKGKGKKDEPPIPARPTSSSPRMDSPLSANEEKITSPEIVKGVVKKLTMYNIQR
jgi:hypothetical protein